ncbi:MAG TPA: histidine phosphatase family protein [Chthonomonadaceae bacterium]|nr:histidine phosphatase family protein [Chthonomonadaceae bacterium]
MKTETLRLFVVRHGITDWNRALRMQGHTDIPLNEEGRRQASRIAARLAALDAPLDAVWSSDLSRARDTAEAIAAPYGLPVRCTPLLREIMLGAWEGLSQTEIEARGDGELLQRYRDSPAGARPPGGETLEHAWDRMLRVRAEICAEFPEGQVVVVGHGGTLRALLAAALDAPVTSMLKFSLVNTSLSILEQTRNSHGSVWRIRSVNDTAHLLC